MTRNIMPDFFIENQFEEGVVGVDEVGRGPLAGPVVAAAVVFLRQDLDFIYMLDDSKKLSLKRRNLLFDEIINCEEVIYDYSVVSNNIIDQINIFNATKKAMIESVNKISDRISVGKVLVDGKHKMLDNKFSEQNIIKGDSKSCSIAAASVIAKVIRDKIMTQLGEEFPYYKWSSNAGYGTKDHVEAIFKYGISEHHRKSFSPIKDIIMKSVI